MRTYTISVEETLYREIDVAAGSRTEAVAKIERMYNQEDVVLDFDDFSGVEFRVVGEAK